MPPKKENKIASIFKWFMIITGAIGVLLAVGAAIMKYGEDKKDAETKQFTSNEMKVKTETWVNSPHNEVELYKIAEENLAQGKIYMEGKKEFDTAFVFVQDILKGDIEDKLDRVRSRGVRDSLAIKNAENDSIAFEEIRDIKREQRIQGIVNDEILELLKELKENQE